AALRQSRARRIPRAQQRGWRRAASHAAPRRNPFAQHLGRPLSRHVFPSSSGSRPCLVRSLKLTDWSVINIDLKAGGCNPPGGGEGGGRRGGKGLGPPRGYPPSGRTTPAGAEAPSFWPNEPTTKKPLCPGRLVRRLACASRGAT